MTRSVEASSYLRCAWFGEGRGQCLLPMGHGQIHQCEQDERLARERAARSVGSGVASVCTEHAYGTAQRLSFQIKVF